jgi:hypothetical protein
VARWAMCWLLVIGMATAGAYLGTNALVGERHPDDSLAMLPLGGPGTPVCQRATRAFVDAGDGAQLSAPPELRAAWDRAARGVLQACADV